MPHHTTYVNGARAVLPRRASTLPVAHRATALLRVAFDPKPYSFQPPFLRFFGQLRKIMKTRHVMCTASSFAYLRFPVRGTTISPRGASVRFVFSDTRHPESRKRVYTKYLCILLCIFCHDQPCSRKREQPQATPMQKRTFGDTASSRQFHPDTQKHHGCTPPSPPTHSSPSSQKAEMKPITGGRAPS